MSRKNYVSGIYTNTTSPYVTYTGATPTFTNVTYDQDGRVSMEGYATPDQVQALVGQVNDGIGHPSRSQTNVEVLRARVSEITRLAWA